MTYHNNAKRYIVYGIRTSFIVSELNAKLKKKFFFPRFETPIDTRVTLFVNSCQALANSSAKQQTFGQKILKSTKQDY
jgi:hypothetical protein